MEKPDRLVDLFRMQRALNPRIGEVNFKRQDSGCTKKNRNDSKHI